MAFSTVSSSFEVGQAEESSVLRTVSKQLINLGLLLVCFLLCFSSVSSLSLCLRSCAAVDILLCLCYFFFVCLACIGSRSCSSCFHFLHCILY